MIEYIVINECYIQFPESKFMSEPHVGATGKINNAVEEVVKEQEKGEDEGEDEGEEEGEKGGNEYSDNFEDAQSPEELDTEETEEPQRPSAPVCT